MIILYFHPLAFQSGHWNHSQKTKTKITLISSAQILIPDLLNNYVHEHLAQEYLYISVNMYKITSWAKMYKTMSYKAFAKPVDTLFCTLK